jgi:ADP-heptose:LPS heptosyltransferase
LLDKTAYRVKQVLYWLLLHINNPFTTKRLLIIKLDAIGDYILFRNNISAIRHSERFKSYTFTMLGNPGFKDIATSLDQSFFEEFIWTDPQVVYNVEFLNWTTFKFLLKIKLKGFETILHPAHSRLLSTDLFIKYLGAKKTIASVGDDINYLGNEKQIGDAIYDELIPVPSYDTFEFFRNIVFTQNLVGVKNEQIQLSLGDTRVQEERVPKVIVLFPGAGLAFRRWSTKKFADLMELIVQRNADIVFYIAGGKTETILAHEIISFAGTNGMVIKDYTGKTNLPEMVDLLRQADLLISNETSAVHMAAAVNLPTICISNGNQFGRFNPYPKELRNNIETVYPYDAFLDPELFEQNVEANRVRSGIDISIITPQKVFEAVCKLLPVT